MFILESRKSRVITDICLVYSTTELPDDGLNLRPSLTDQLAEGVLEDKSSFNLLQGMKIGIERAHREEPAVCTESCIRRAAHIVDPQPREVLYSLPGWWALVSEKTQYFYRESPRDVWCFHPHWTGKEGYFSTDGRLQWIFGPFSWRKYQYLEKMCAGWWSVPGSV